MPTELPPPASRSWWLEEALAADPGETCPPLEEEITADVLIVGGGYTGMWTAYFLKEQDPSIDVVVVERDICGGGPSGRNGGFANALWEDLEILEATFGAERAVEACEIAERSVPAIGEWCERHGVDAWFRTPGHMGVAASSAQDGAWNSWVETAQRLGVAEGRLIGLSAEEVRARCDSPVFRAGILTPKMATVQPARLSRGLRRVNLERGVRIFEQTPVVRFRGGPPAEAETPGGGVRAGTAVLGVNAWAAQWKRFRRLIFPRATYIVLTAPVPKRLEEIGWTGEEGIYDFRTALHYLRTTVGGRLAFGAASSRAGFGTGLGPRLDYDSLSVRRLVHDLGRMFPSFRDVPLECAWGGPMDISALHVPFFGTFPSGNVHYGLGFTGGGVGPCHMAGQILAGLSLGIENEYTRLPLVGTEPKAFPPEPLLSTGTLLIQEAIVRKDEAEDRGVRPNPVVNLLAHIPRKLGYNLGP